MPASKRSEMKTEKLPSGALHFMEEGLSGDCSVQFEDKEGKKVPKLNMVVYSGGIIKNHFWWGNLAIDLAGVSLPKPKYPVLAQHDIERKVGFTGKPIIEDNIRLDPEKTKFVSTKDAEEFLQLSEDGFPFQASMYIPPVEIERVPEGQTAEVNGFKLKGPGTVFRKSVFKEASVVVFGADSDTSSAAAFSKDGNEEEIEYTELAVFEEEENSKEKEVTDLKTVAEFKEKYPELFAELTKEIKTQFQAELSAAQTENTQLQATISAQNEKLEGQESRIANLEKEDAINKENALRGQADTIFGSKFEASDIPDRLRDKVRGMLNHNKFVKEGKLDVEAFTAAVEAELKDWEGRGATETVMGSSFLSKGEETGETKKLQQREKESKDTADDLLELAGQKVDRAAA